MKPICIILISVFFFHLGFAQDKATTMLFPYLSASKKIGYCNSEGQLIIASKYDYAGPLKSGYAVVGIENSFGVINGAGEIIIPIKYSNIEFRRYGQFELLVLKIGYNTRVRFWDWKILPNFNILSTSYSGPFLETKMPRANWNIMALPSKKVLFTANQSDTEGGRRDWKNSWSPDSGLPGDVSISAVGNLLLVNNNAYRLNTNKQLKKISDKVFDIIDSNSVIAYKNKNLYPLNVTSGVKSKESYLLVDSFKVNVESNQHIEIRKRKSNSYPFLIITTDLFKDQKGKIFFFPDLTKPFPMDIEDYKKDTEKITGEEIMDKAIVIASIPDSKYFLIVSGVGNPRKRCAFLLRDDGKWNTDLPAYEGFSGMLGTGEIVFTRTEKKGILTKDLKLKAFPFDYDAYQINFSPDMFLGKDVVSKKYGIYNVLKEAWQVTPLYSFLSTSNTPRVAVYSLTEVENGVNREKFGLLDIDKNIIITPPLYNSITADCYVAKTENGQRVSFYINPSTGKEYRE